jgi:hypothetical protein
MHVHFEARNVESNIAYFYLSDFIDPMRVIPAFSDAVKSGQAGNGRGVGANKRVVADLANKVNKRDIQRYFGANQWQKFPECPSFPSRGSCQKSSM